MSRSQFSALHNLCGYQIKPLVVDRGDVLFTRRCKLGESCQRCNATWCSQQSTPLQVRLEFYMIIGLFSAHLFTVAEVKSRAWYCMPVQGCVRPAVKVLQALNHTRPCAQFRSVAKRLGRCVHTTNAEQVCVAAEPVSRISL